MTMNLLVRLGGPAAGALRAWSHMAAELTAAPH
jgi:hypothetical protein